MRRAESYLTRRRFAATLAPCVLLWLLVGGLCLFFGQEHIPARGVASILTGHGVGGPYAYIVLHVRVPRVLLGLMVGGGLAVTGTMFQALLRNPLATPHTIGVSAGGALGAALAIALGWTGPKIGPVGTVQFFALTGALINMGIIYVLAQRKEFFSPLRLLLAGVTLGLICAAMITFLRFISAPDELVRVDRWLMGGLNVHGYGSLASILPLFLPALVLLFMEAAAMNQLSLGEEMAAGRGVDVAAAQARSFLAGAALTAVLVSVAGPVGFVGLIVPHVLRAIFGPDHRLLLFLAFLGGGAFLAGADTIARVAFAPSELPVGVLTAMLGGPFFLLILVTRMR